MKKIFGAEVDFSIRAKEKLSSTTKFLSGIGWKRTIEVHDLSKLGKAAKPVPKVIPCTIKVPTKQDYKNIPKKFVVGRPLLKWQKLLKSCQPI